MSVDELIMGWRRVYNETSSPVNSVKRGFKTLVNTGSFVNASINLFWNYYNYRAIQDANQPESGRIPDAGDQPWVKAAPVQ